MCASWTLGRDVGWKHRTLGAGGGGTEAEEGVRSLWGGMKGVKGQEKPGQGENPSEGASWMLRTRAFQERGGSASKLLQRD